VYGTQMGDIAATPITASKFSIKNVRLELIQGYWIPMEGDFFLETTQDNTVYRERRHHKRTSIELNPDFTKIGAFIPNLPDGTNILVTETPGIKYIWLNGKTVPHIDGPTFNKIDKTIDGLKKQQQK
jgi:hypothetical protein